MSNEPNTAAIDKAVTRALKDERSRVKAAVKVALDNAKEIANKAEKKAVTASLKDLQTSLAAPF